MALSDVSNILWRERQLLEMLLFKLEEEQLLLAAGRSRWLEHATREVEAVLDGIRQAELVRATEVDGAAVELGLGPGPSLRALADAAPAPWNDLLAEHRAAFLALTEEIIGVAGANRDLLARGYQAARQMMAELGAGDGAAEGATYSSSGATNRARGPRLLDEVL